MELVWSNGPCVLVLQEDKNRQPVHIVWGIARGKESPGGKDEYQKTYKVCSCR